MKTLQEEVKKERKAKEEVTAEKDRMKQEKDTVSNYKLPEIFPA